VALAISVIYLKVKKTFIFLPKEKGEKIPQIYMFQYLAGENKDNTRLGGRPSLPAGSKAIIL